jgi:hypothetical protein
MTEQVIDVDGLVETRTLLRQFEPDLLKRLDARVNLAARNLKSGAQANFGQTGAGGAAYRIKSKLKPAGFSKSVITMAGSVPRGVRWSTNPGTLAAVFEFAAGVRDARPENVQRVKSLIETLNARYGSTGRFLWQAWDDIKEAEMAGIAATIAEIEAEYTARMGV